MFFFMHIIIILFLLQNTIPDDPGLYGQVIFRLQLFVFCD